MRTALTTRRPRPKAPDPALLFRAVRWARLPGHGHTIAGACKRFGITPTAYRKARRALGSLTNLTSDDDIVLAGLSPGRPTSVENLIYYYDWVNHGVLTPAETEAILERLIARRLVRRVGDRYELTGEWP